MSKTQLFKTITTFVVGAGTTRIVNGIVQTNVPTEKVTDKVAVTAASFVIGSMAADATKKYTDTAIDEVIDLYNKTVTKGKNS